MNDAAKILASIPDGEWLDLGYMVMIPSVLVVGLPLLILWIRP